MIKRNIYTLKTLSCLGLLTCFLTSCSITKCRYSNGFNIDLGLGKKNEKTSASKHKHPKIKSPHIVVDKVVKMDSTIENTSYTKHFNTSNLDSQRNFLFNGDYIIHQKFEQKSKHKIAQKMVLHPFIKENKGTKKSIKTIKKSSILVEIFKAIIFFIAIVVYMFMFLWVAILLFGANLYIINPWLSAFLLLLTVIIGTTLLFWLSHFFRYDWFFGRNYRYVLPGLIFIAVVLLIRSIF